MATTSFLFLISYIGGLLAALFRNPVYGLYTYVAVFYLHPPSRWWGQFMPELRWSLIAAVVTLFATWRLAADEERQGWQSHTGIKLFIVFAAWLWFQWLWSITGELHEEAVMLYTKYVVLFYMMYRLLTDWDRVRMFVAINVAGCLYLSWLAWQAPPWGRLEGVGGPGIDEANALGMQLVTGLVFAVALLIEKRWKFRLLAIVAIPLVVNGIIQTESRGATVGLVAAGLAMLYLGARRHRRFLVLCSLIGLAVLIRTAPENFVERMSNLIGIVEQTEEMDTSAESRLVLIDAQWRMFLEHPWGTGHRGTAILSNRYLEKKYLAINTLDDEMGGSRSSHNMIMTALVEHGIPGIILVLAIIAWALGSLRRLKFWDPDTVTPELEIYRMTVGGALVSVLVAGMFTDYLKAEVMYWCLALIAVMTDIATRESLHPPVAEQASADGTSGLTGHANGTRP